MSLPPLGRPTDSQRTCSRVLRVEGDVEVLCRRPAVQHIIWWWREAQSGENFDDCWDHGFACPDHWHELRARWTYAAAHVLTPACGMPGSFCHFEENTCTFDDLPTIEPIRVLAVGRPLEHARSA